MGDYISYYIKEYLVELGLLENRFHSINKLNTDLEFPINIYVVKAISSLIDSSIIVREGDDLRSALDDQADQFSIGALTLVTLLHHRDMALLELDVGDYELAIYIADKLKQATLDTIIDTFENPQFLNVGNSGTLLDIINNPTADFHDNWITLTQSNFKPNESARGYRTIMQLREFLDKCKSENLVQQSVEELGRQTFEELGVTAMLDATAQAIESDVTAPNEMQN